MPQPTAPASGLQLLTDFSEVQTKDGGSCGDSPPQATLHRPLQCKDPVMWLLRDGPLSHGFSEKDPPRGFSEKDPSTWLLQEAQLVDREELPSDVWGLKLQL